MTPLKLGLGCSLILTTLVLSCAQKEPEGPVLPGQSAYAFYCGACHGKDGRGAEHLFPPLAGSEWALGDPEVPIRIVLHGLEGRLRIQGGEYMNVMAPLKRRMDDEAIALVLTYVRSAWGNRATAVTASQVAAVRAATSQQEAKYKVSEMEQLRKELGQK